MMMNLLRRALTLRVLYIIIFVCVWTRLYADERIISWDSDITVRQDGSMSVIEELKLMAEGREIKHGIVREFPTRYKNSFGLRYNVGFDVIQVLLDGRLVDYKAVDGINGVRVFIGDQTNYVQPGEHVYTIVYETTKQLGFFDTHDELYWNVTGLGWRFIIESVNARVHIPDTKLNGEKLANDAIHFEGYTGSFGAKGQDYVASVKSDGVAHFSTARSLRPHEGLTIVVTWPKGVIKTHSIILDYLRDNLHLIILLLALFAICVWYVWSYYITRKSIKYGAVIPLFHPPHDADPGALRYILEMRYESKCLAAMIVHMAVRGLLVIEHVPGKLFAKAHYILKKRTDVPVEQTELESRLMQTWFKKSEAIALTQENSTSVAASGTLLSNHYERSYAIGYFSSNYDCVSIGWVITLLAALLAVFSVFEAYYDFLFWAILIAQAAMHGIMYAVLPAYTQAGQKFKEDIEGFKMFLCTTETERLKVIGTPPTKTPELFERYLPYAIALDVEKQWSEQFACVFKELEHVGTPYQPSWFYAGHPFMYHDLIFLSSGLGGSLNDAVYSAAKPISSATTRPGSSSGSGGGGYSGGGGGGGGGGGW